MEAHFQQSFEVLQRDFNMQVLQLYRECNERLVGPNECSRHVHTPRGAVEDDIPFEFTGQNEKIGFEDHMRNIMVTEHGKHLHQSSFGVNAKMQEPPRAKANNSTSSLAINSESKEPQGLNHEFSKAASHMTYLVDRLHGRETVKNDLEKLIFSDIYVWTITFSVILQAVLLGFEVQMEMDIEVDRIKNEPESKALKEIPLALHACTYGLNIFFLVEVFFRLAVLRKRFFFPNDPDAQAWNIFDLVIVLACVPDFFHVLADELPFVHAFRLTRVIRVLRLARGIPALRKMIYVLLHCITSLLWLVALLFVLMYMFGLAFMQGAASDLKDMDAPSPANATSGRLLAAKARGDTTGCIVADVVFHPYESFSTIYLSMQTLFHLLTGNEDFETTLKPIMESSFFFKSLGLFFTVFFYFGFMNVATGLFVDRAMQIAKQDREMVMSEAAMKDSAEMEAMRELFEAADEDDDGRLSIAELRRVIQHPDVKSWLATIDLDFTEDFDAVVKILDPENKGVIQADEFYQVLGKFRGPARKVETMLLLLETRMANQAFFENHNKLHQAMQHHNQLNVIARSMDTPLHSARSLPISSSRMQSDYRSFGGAHDANALWDI